MRRMRGAWGFEFCRPFPVPGKLGFFYVHTRSVHGAACLTCSSDGRRTRRYPKHETGQDGEDRKSPCPHRSSNSRPSGLEESALSTRPHKARKPLKASALTLKGKVATRISISYSRQGFA